MISSVAETQDISACYFGDEKGKQLTQRELEVLKLLVQGKSNIEIADELIISAHTAKAHVCNILQKMGVDDRVQAAVKAVREGIVEQIVCIILLWFS